MQGKFNLTNRRIRRWTRRLLRDDWKRDRRQIEIGHGSAIDVYQDYSGPTIQQTGHD